MTDIVERLNPGVFSVPTHLARAMAEAADEIKRLRKDVESLANTIDDAADEIERLRAALRECVEVWRPLLADADLTAHENPAFLALMRADLALLENNRD